MARHVTISITSREDGDDFAQHVTLPSDNGKIRDLLVPYDSRDPETLSQEDLDILAVRALALEMCDNPNPDPNMDTLISEIRSAMGWLY